MGLPDDSDSHGNDNKKHSTSSSDRNEMITNPCCALEDKKQEEAVVPVTPYKQSQEQHVFSPELLKLYYARLFPYELLCSWLSYSTSCNSDSDNTTNPGRKTYSSKLFSRREFSFTLEPIPGEEIYIRYQSFVDSNELQKAIQRRQPHKIDIGAVFTYPPKDKAAYDATMFHPVQRELVFDIDLTDYDDIRHCGCSGAKICSKCWTYMTMAVKVIDYALKEDFGFEHIAWFYSGRRGVHAWVCDESARQLSNEARSAVANYLEVCHSEYALRVILTTVYFILILFSTTSALQVAVGKKRKENLSTTSSVVHPMLERAYDILEPYFLRDVLPASGHGLLATPEKWEALLDSLPKFARETVGANLKEKWARYTPQELSSKDKWEQLLHHLRVKFDLEDSSANDNSSRKGQVKGSSNKRPKLSTAMGETDQDKLRVALWPMETVFLHTYPRLDINVSKMQNHLLKSPFCVHPKTGRVCVPIDSSRIDDFDPFAVPTLPQLVRELDDHHAREKVKNNDEETVNGTDDDDNAGDSFEHDWQKTSLKPYFETFRKNFLVPMQKEWRHQERDQAEKLAAIRGDF